MITDPSLDGKWWTCPACTFVIGFVSDDNELVIPRWPGPTISIVCGRFTCVCGCTIEWHPSKPPRVLDSPSPFVVK